MTVATDPVASEWLSAIQAELHALSEEGRYRLALLLRSLYVGGGTPSHMGPTATDGPKTIRLRSA